MNVDRRAKSHHVEQSRCESSDRTKHLVRADVTLARSYTLDATASDIDAQNFGFLVNLDTALISTATVAPSHRVMTSDRAGLVIQRSKHWSVTAAFNVHHRNRALHIC